MTQMCELAQYCYVTERLARDELTTSCALTIHYLTKRTLSLKEMRFKYMSSIVITVLSVPHSPAC